ncbi:protein YgfX [Nitrincola tapanii]|uniref:Toxin CptA n=1 Tax=Nitrincola tapanii TaxID=1708751 RepID=A0A5A9VZ56_9GAMM|nr:protein YgfX [Nitrincola tapanii]KAA0873817.1 hypothetical protein E1H14_10690 [Nitrincola tapanii]
MLGFNQLEIKVHPSPWLRIFFVAAHILFILCLHLAYFPFLANLVLSLVLILSLSVTLNDYVKIAEFELYWDCIEHDLWIKPVHQDWLRVIKLHSFTLLPWLITMQVYTETEAQKRWLIIAKDSVNSDDFRRLTVRLNLQPRVKSPARDS